VGIIGFIEEHAFAGTKSRNEAARTSPSTHTKIPGPGGGGGGDAHGGVVVSRPLRAAPAATTESEPSTALLSKPSASGDIHLAVGWDDVVASNARQRVLDSKVICLCRTSAVCTCHTFVPALVLHSLLRLCQHRWCVFCTAAATTVFGDIVWAGCANGNLREFHLPYGLTPDSSRSTVLGLHQGAVTAVDVSSNSLFLFTSGEDGSLFVAAASKSVERCDRVWSYVCVHMRVHVCVCDAFCCVGPCERFHRRVWT
jgi:hypothetical protein